MAFDFPATPALNDVYASGGVSYTWNGYAWLASGATGPVPPADYVLKAGDVMTGPLQLPGAPTAPLHAATKAYVDSITQSLPQGTVGQALVVGVVRNAGWGNPIEGGNF